MSDIGYSPKIWVTKNFGPKSMDHNFKFIFTRSPAGSNYHFWETTEIVLFILICDKKFKICCRSKRGFSYLKTVLQMSPQK